MSTTITNALAAYANVANAGLNSGDSVAPTSDAGTTGGADFASMVKDGIQTAIDSSKHGEEMSKQAVAGKADLRDVVTAVNDAEVTLETVVAVRDKVINAYNDILRMSI